MESVIQDNLTIVNSSDGSKAKPTSPISEILELINKYITNSQTSEGYDKEFLQTELGIIYNDFPILLNIQEYLDLNEDEKILVKESIFENILTLITTNNSNLRPLEIHGLLRDLIFDIAYNIAYKIFNPTLPYHYIIILSEILKDKELLSQIIKLLSKIQKKNPKDKLTLPTIIRIYINNVKDSGIINDSNILHQVLKQIRELNLETLDLENTDSLNKPIIIFKESTNNDLIKSDEDNDLNSPYQSNEQDSIRKELRIFENSSDSLILMLKNKLGKNGISSTHYPAVLLKLYQSMIETRSNSEDGSFLGFNDLSEFEKFIEEIGPLFQIKLLVDDFFNKLETPVALDKIRINTFESFKKSKQKEIKLVSEITVEYRDSLKNLNIEINIVFIDRVEDYNYFISIANKFTFDFDLDKLKELLAFFRTNFGVGEKLELFLRIFSSYHIRSYGLSPTKFLSENTEFLSKIFKLSVEEIQLRTKSLEKIINIYRKGPGSNQTKYWDFIEGLLKEFLNPDLCIINKLYENQIYIDLDSYDLFETKSSLGKSFFSEDCLDTPNEFIKRIKEFNLVLGDSRKAMILKKIIIKYKSIYGTTFDMNMNLNLAIFIANKFVELPDSYLNEFLELKLLHIDSDFSLEIPKIKHYRYNSYRKEFKNKDEIENFLFYKKNEKQFWEVVDFVKLNDSHPDRDSYPSRLFFLQSFVIDSFIHNNDNLLSYFKIFFQKEARELFLKIKKINPILYSFWLEIPYKLRSFIVNTEELKIIINYFKKEEAYSQLNNIIECISIVLIELKFKFNPEALIRFLENLLDVEYQDQIKTKKNILSEIKTNDVNTIIQEILTNPLFNLENINSIEDLYKRFIVVQYPTLAKHVSSELDKNILINIINNLAIYEIAKPELKFSEPLFFQYFNEIFQYNSDDFNKKFNLVRIAFKEYIKNKDQEQNGMALLKRIIFNSSKEIELIISGLMYSIFESEDPDVEFSRIETIFLNPLIPFVGKIFMVFHYYYGRDKNYSGLNLSSVPLSKVQSRININPVSKAVFERIIARDLFKSSIRSGDFEIYTYVDSIKNFLDSISIQNQTILEWHQKSLNKNDCINSLKKIIGLLSLLPNSNYQIANLSIMINDAKTDEDVEKIIGLLQTIIGKSSIEINKWIKGTFLKYLGFDSIQDILSLFSKVREECNNRNIVLFKRIKSHGFLTPSMLSSGGYNVYLKGFSSMYLTSVLQSFRSPELLGSHLKSDMTNIDTDIALMSETPSLKESIDSSIANNYGDIIAIFIEDDNFKSNYEVVNNNHVLGETHFGIRSAVGWYDLSALILKNNNSILLEKLKYEIIKKGVFIPILDLESKVLFDQEEYDKMRHLADGIKNFYGDKINSKLNSDRNYLELDNDIDKEIKELIQNKESTDRQRLEVNQRILKCIEKAGIEMEEKSWLSGILHESGSSSRYTQIAGSSDFDLHLEITTKDWDKLKILEEYLKDEFKPQASTSNTHDSRYNQFRFFDCATNSGLTSIDLGVFIRNNDRDFYTHNEIEAKMKALTSDNIQDPKIRSINENRLYANIILAKKILKEAKAYKRFQDNVQMGLGGSGVETWILLNGGSILQAFHSFYINALDKEGKFKSLEEFRKDYKIISIANNIRTGDVEDYLINNLSKEGYERMFEAIKSALQRWKVILPR